MYPTSFRLFFRLWPYVIFAVVGEVVVQITKEQTSISGGLTFVSVLIWSFLAFNAHAALLLPESRDKAEDNRRVMGFALRTFGLGALMMIPVVFGAIAIFAGAFAGEVSRGIEVFDLVAIGVLLAICFIVVFGLLGTLLPAFVADRGRGVGVAFRRGCSQFFWIMSQFLAGPVLIFALAYAVIFGGHNWMHPHVDLLNAIYIPNVPLFVILIAGYLIQALGTVMIAWVLSTAFLRAEGNGET